MKNDFLDLTIIRHALSCKWGIYMGKYGTFVVKDLNEDILGKVELRIADHSPNPQNLNMNGADYMLGIVIGKKDETARKFAIPDNIEIVRYDELNEETAIYILTDVQDIILDQFSFWLGNGEDYNVYFVNPDSKILIDEYRQS